MSLLLFFEIYKGKLKNYELLVAQKHGIWVLVNYAETLFSLFLAFYRTTITHLIDI